MKIKQIFAVLAVSASLMSCNFLDIRYLTTICCLVRESGTQGFSYRMCREMFHMRCKM